VGIGNLQMGTKLSQRTTEPRVNGADREIEDLRDLRWQATPVTQRDDDAALERQHGDGLEKVSIPDRLVLAPGRDRRGLLELHPVALEELAARGLSSLPPPRRRAVGRPGSRAH
jgi:hypothetical protein